MKQFVNNKIEGHVPIDSWTENTHLYIYKILCLNLALTVTRRKKEGKLVCILFACLICLGFLEANLLTDPL